MNAGRGRVTKGNAVGAAGKRNRERRARSVGSSEQTAALLAIASPEPLTACRNYQWRPHLRSRRPFSVIGP
jgi:hypothetical protein